MEPIILVVAIIAVIISGVTLVTIIKMKSDDTDKKQTEMLYAQLEQLNQRIGAVSEESTRMNTALKEDVSRSISDMSNMFSQLYRQNGENINARLQSFEQRLQGFQAANSDALSKVKDEVSKQLELIRSDNNTQMESIRKTVDDKLQSTLESKLTQSFKAVSERLEQVHKGLGEMQSIAGSVGDLKKVLSNVKTRGILGEIQLGAIIGEILTPAQYDTEAQVVPTSSARVEFAVKLPAEHGTVYLPIDSKFPGDTYSAYVEASESGDKDRAELALKQLKDTLKKCAKDIRDKYIQPPYTTSFAIMFLPFEGLYATAVNNGMVELLQRDYNVNIAGPSTMAALLNSLQMGFKTLAVQKRSNEVWKILAEVKVEFEKFSDTLDKTRKAITKAGDELDGLVGTRTRAITRKLDGLQKLDYDG